MSGASPAPIAQIPLAQVLPLDPGSGVFVLPWRKFFQYLATVANGAVTPEQLAVLTALANEALTTAQKALTAADEALAEIPTITPDNLGAVMAFLGVANLDSGTVTLVATDATLSGGPITDSGTLAVVSAPKLTTARTFSYMGDVSGGPTSFDGSANVSTAITLDTVNANVGTFGDATHAAQVTVNAKGLVTAASAVAITFPSYVTSYFGSGAPSGLHNEGDTYYDTSGSPYVGYVQHSGAWHQVA